MMDERKPNDFFTIGTPQCGLLLAAIGALLALALLYLGFWRTVFVALLAGVGFYVGAVGRKSDLLRKIINKVFPPKGA